MFQWDLITPLSWYKKIYNLHLYIYNKTSGILVTNPTGNVSHHYENLNFISNFLRQYWFRHYIISPNNNKMLKKD